MADRLATIAPFIVSLQKRGFIPRRSIHDCICITSEAINMLPKRVFGRNMVLKINIVKDFDTLDQEFLNRLMTKFGFNNTFCSWIRTILHSGKLSISMNGESVGFFSYKCGVRRPPISLPLLHHGGSFKQRNFYASFEGKTSAHDQPDDFSTPSNVLYANDIMVFCRETSKNVYNLLILFKAYEETLGQVINTLKSRFFAGSIPNCRLRDISGLLGFNYGAPSSPPFVYFDVPIFKGKPKKISSSQH